MWFFSPCCYCLSDEPFCVRGIIKHGRKAVATFNFMRCASKFCCYSMLILLLLACQPSAWAQWEQQTSGVDVQLRGISAVSPKIAWASGAKGTVLRTVDSGHHWEKLAIAGTESLDFRDIQAFDDKTAFVLSI